MITSILIRNAIDAYASSLALDDLVYPLSKFEFPPIMEGSKIGKQQNPGRWPTRRYVREMDITIEGRILATDTSDYWVKRKALMVKAVPDPTNTAYDPIRIDLVIDGDGNTYTAQCSLESLGGALDVALASPQMSEFQLQYSCSAGYWTGPGGLVIL
jgi:hypothetical protein